MKVSFAENTSKNWTKVRAARAVQLFSLCIQPIIGEDSNTITTSCHLTLSDILFVINRQTNESKFICN